MRGHVDTSGSYLAGHAGHAGHNGYVSPELLFERAKKLEKYHDLGKRMPEKIEDG